MTDKRSLLHVPPSWERAFFGPPYLDTPVLFNRWVHEIVAAASTGSTCMVLDIGAGPASPFFRGPGRHVIGVDIDPVVMTNKNLDEAFVTDGRTFPLADNSVDVAQSTYVLEHLEDPLEHFREVSRVLKPGGHFLFLTVNAWHPAVLLFRAAPRRVQELLEQQFVAKDPAGEEYPVFFRANSARQVRRLALQSGLKVLALSRREEAPYYFRRFLPLWLAAAGYTFVSQRLPLMRPIATTLYGCLQKQ